MAILTQVDYVPNQHPHANALVHSGHETMRESSEIYITVPRRKFCEAGNDCAITGRLRRSPSQVR
jgi:hypothetical protein